MPRLSSHPSAEIVEVKCILCLSVYPTHDNSSVRGRCSTVIKRITVCRRSLQLPSQFAVAVAVCSCRRSLQLPSQFAVAVAVYLRPARNLFGLYVDCEARNPFLSQ